jgi:hypothetical protein
MSEKIRILLESLTIEEIEELKNLVVKNQNFDKKPTFSFSKITDEILDELFDIDAKYDDSKFDDWLNNDLKIENQTLDFLQNLIKNNISLISKYNEEDLKIHFLAPLFYQINFKIENKKIRDFYEQSFSYSNSRGTVRGAVDFVIAKGKRKAQKPYFFVQEFKQESESSDPEPQLVAELITAIELNNWQKIKGIFIKGAIWNFVILEKLGTDKYQYFVSRPYNSVVISDLELIFKALLFVKNEIINLEESNLNE